VGLDVVFHSLDENVKLMMSVGFYEWELFSFVAIRVVKKKEGTFLV